MLYLKPEIVTLEDAVDAIQGQTFKSTQPLEETPNSVLSPAPAYEADE